MKILRQILVLVFLGFLVIPNFSVFAKSLKKVSIKLDWKYEVQFLGLIAAKHNQYYNNQGLDVSIVTSKNVKEISEIPNHVFSGKYDFATGSGSMVSAQNRGLPVVLLATIFQFSPNVIFAMKDSGIRTIKDLKGHTIVIKGDSWRNLLVKFFNNVGMDLSDLREIPGGFDMTPFFEKRVDIWTGFITNEVVVARLKGYEIVTFPLFEYGFAYLGASIYSSRRYVREQRESVRKFIKASIDGWTWAIENPQKAVNLFFRVFPEKQKDAKFHQASFNATIPLIRPPGIKIGSIDCDEHLKKIHLKDQHPKDFCNADFLE